MKFIRVTHYIEQCDEDCPFAKETHRTFCGWRCSKADKYLDDSDCPIPDWCPLEDVPEDKMEKE